MTTIDYMSVEIRENHEPLVDLADCGFVLEPVYFQAGMSSERRVFLREGSAQKLMNVQKSLGKYHLKIWDGYRPRTVQNNIYQNYWIKLKQAHPDWDEEKLKTAVGFFITPPYDNTRIPAHATGGTVDLTVVDEHGTELDMGTGFDCFGDEAAPFHFEIYRDKPEITRNRKMLREAMMAEDFTLSQSEWWHFDWGNQVWALRSGKSFAFYGEAKEVLHSTTAKENGYI